MNILVLSAVFPPRIVGGAEVSAFNLATALSRRGHKVSVVTMAEPSEPEVWGAEENGLSMYRLHFPRKQTVFAAHTQPLSKLAWQIWHLQDFFDPRQLFIMARVLRQVRPDHVNIHLLDGIGFNVLPLISWFGASISFVLHDLSLACTLSTMFKNGKTCKGQCAKCRKVSQLKGLFLRMAKTLSFISPSRANLETLKAHVPQVASRPSMVIRNLPDLLPPDMPTHKPDPKGCIRILFAGRLHHTKGIDMLLESLAPLASRYAFHLTIYGKGELEASLKKTYGDAPWVTFAGFVPQDDVTRAVARHDLVCTPSIWAEVYGRVTAQALELGVPVLGSNLGGTVELIRHEETGRLLPAGDVAAWRATFEEIFKNPALLATWKNNVAKYASEFDAETITAQYETFVKIVRGS